MSGLDDDGFVALHNTIRRGDLIGVKGYPGKSKRGELSVFPNSFVVLAPCLHMLPKYKLDNQVSYFVPNSANILLSIYQRGSCCHQLHNRLLYVPCAICAAVHCHLAYAFVEFVCQLPAYLCQECLVVSCLAFAVAVHVVLAVQH